MAKHITDGTINSESTFQDETVTYSESETIEYTSCVYYADTFNDLVLSNTQVTLNSGLSANNTTLNGNGILYVSDGGAANGTKINEDGKMIVSDGGLADNSLINAFGSAEIENGGTANETKVNGGTFSVSSGAVANNTVLTGCQTEWEGGNLLSTAKMNVSNGGSANGITINAWSCLEVEKGGKVSNISIGNGGELYIAENGILSGSLSIKGGTVYADEGAVIDFTVAGTAAEGAYLIDNLALIEGTPTYTVTVDANQKNGTYNLAQGAHDFAGSLSIGTVKGSFGTITVNGDDLSYNGVKYSLDKNDGNLTLTVVNTNKKSSPNSNLLSNGVSQIVGWDKEKGAVGFIAADGNVAPTWRGVWDWDGQDVDLWRVVGVGRFAGSTVDYDGILLYNGIGTTFAAWTNLNDPSYGYVDLCHVDGNFNTRTLANMNNNEYDDVLIYDEKGSFGVVLDGTHYKDIWHVDDAASNVWQLRGAGSFGGNEDALVVENTATKHLYFWQNNDSTFNTWNWSQTLIDYIGDTFEFAAIGDFSGDGIDDIIVRNKIDNSLWLWDDGQSANSHWVVTPDNGFKIEAVGDYNNDGKDELLVREYNTGWGGIGYYDFYGGQLWNDLNARIETNLESKFAVIA